MRTLMSALPDDDALLPRLTPPGPVARNIILRLRGRRKETAGVTLVLPGHGRTRYLSGTAVLRGAEGPAE